jgi:hypothetical protein
LGFDFTIENGHVIDGICSYELKANGSEEGEFAKVGSSGSGATDSEINATCMTRLSGVHAGEFSEQVGVKRL